MAEAFGVEVADLPEFMTALEVVVLVKAIDESGSLVLVERVSSGITWWEALGMAVTFTDTARARLTD